jgi:hypothetical protein
VVQQRGRDDRPSIPGTDLALLDVVDVPSAPPLGHDDHAVDVPAVADPGQAGDVDAGGERARFVRLVDALMLHGVGVRVTGSAPTPGQQPDTDVDDPVGSTVLGGAVPEVAL